MSVAFLFGLYIMNLADYVGSVVSNGGTKAEFYRTIMDECGVSLNTAIRWCCLDSKTQKKNYLVALQRLTGLPINDIFRRHKK